MMIYCFQQQQTIKSDLWPRTRNHGSAKGHYIDWVECPDGDGEHRMRYFVRYTYDADDDGLVAK